MEAVPPAPTPTPGNEEIVVKPMSTKLRHIGMFSGNTILGDGAVIMIIDPNGIAQSLGTAAATQSEIADDNAATRTSTDGQLTSLLVFRSGSSQPKAVPLALVTRLEEIAVEKIELSNGRHMVQYREQLMPLVEMEGVAIRESGVQPILVFADDGRAMGLVVDEIIDIVEEHLSIEVASSREGVLGSAVVKGQATEVIDVGHFLPMAFADWFSRKEMRLSSTAQTVLLVDDSAFFRNMLAPVLKAAGYRVTVAQNGQEGLAVLRSGNTFDVVLTDIENDFNKPDGQIIVTVEDPSKGTLKMTFDELQEDYPGAANKHLYQTPHVGRWSYTHCIFPALAGTREKKTTAAPALKTWAARVKFARLWEEYHPGKERGLPQRALRAELDHLLAWFRYRVDWRGPFEQKEPSFATAVNRRERDLQAIQQHLLRLLTVQDVLQHADDEPRGTRRARAKPARR